MSASTTSSARSFPAAPSPARPRSAPCNCSRKLKHEPRGILHRRHRLLLAPANRLQRGHPHSGTANGRTAQKMGVGSGIVIDSNAADEFRECQLKAEFLTRPLKRHSPWSRRCCGGPDIRSSSCIWTGFEDSAAILRIRLRPRRNQSRAACRGSGIPQRSAAQSQIASRFRRQHCTSSTKYFRLTPHDAKPPRVCIAPQRTDSRDRMLFHKTTHRPLYASAFKAASEAGFCDVLFLNERGEVTEGAISNIFIEKAGRWFTPPISCGAAARRLPPPPAGIPARYGRAGSHS